ncbi:efflux transporter outer membrane subunit [Telmatospirillum sp.]|uniref:efflux transporter outer membrane subunit n=1 Tax=Telmatospirillum sp. TaxID=2079197 RepID=UPI002842F1EE|nr:efflux transporter outer membrane subunit [Telmatospirillum sp.]MDR3439062.1 efflux transporter outer membrane subunit [Telmatospirillum sp.]
MKDFRVLSLLAATLALTTSCTVGPDYRPPAVDTPADWAETSAVGNQDRSAASTERLARWWSSFADPTLDNLVGEAIANNHDVRIAAQRVIEARADRTIAAAGGEPTLSATASAQRSRQSTAMTLSPLGGVANSFAAGFDASWEVDLFGKTRRSVEAADATVEAAIWNRRAVLVSLLGELGTDYTALRAAQERIAIAERTIAADQDALDLAQQKFDHGLGTELDTAQARAELEQVKASLPQLETQVAQNAHALAVLLGKQPGTLLASLQVPAAMPLAPPTLPVTIPSELLRNRPDIRQSERSLAAANAEIGVAVANLFPSFTISPSLGLDAGKLNKLLTGSGVTWGVGASLGQPIYNGGALDAAVDKATAVTEQDRLTYEQTVLKAFAEVEDALVALGNERQRHDRLGRTVDANRVALQRATELYRAGLSPFINVVNSEKNLFGAEDSLAQSDQTLTQQTVALYKALGGGWQESADDGMEKTTTR